jgi:hypothetical protein
VPRTLRVTLLAIPSDEHTDAWLALRFRPTDRIQDRVRPAATVVAPTGGLLAERAVR